MDLSIKLSNRLQIKYYHPPLTSELRDPWIHGTVFAGPFSTDRADDGEERMGRSVRPKWDHKGRRSQLLRTSRELSEPKASSSQRPLSSLQAQEPC